MMNANASDIVLIYLTFRNLTRIFNCLIFDLFDVPQFDENFQFFEGFAN